MASSITCTGTALSTTTCGTCSFAWDCNFAETSSKTLYHNPDNASQGKLDLAIYFGCNVYADSNLGGAIRNPYVAVGGDVSTSVWNGGDWVMNGPASGTCFTASRSGGFYDTAIIADSDTQISATPRVGIHNGVWGPSATGCSDNTMYLDLNENQRIWSPEGLTGSVVKINPIYAKITANLNSWGRGQMKGTPYTSGGGRTWNFCCEIYDGDTRLKRKELNTGETKSATFEWTTSEIFTSPLPIDKPLRIRIVASNDYQKYIEYWINTRTSYIGWVVRPDGTAKKIGYGIKRESSVPSEGDGAISYITTNSARRP